MRKFTGFYLIVVLVISMFLTSCIVIEVDESVSKKKTEVNEKQSEKKESTDKKSQDEKSEETDSRDKSSKEETEKKGAEKKEAEEARTVSEEDGADNERKYEELEAMLDVPEDQVFKLTFGSELRGQEKSIEAYIKVYSDISCEDEYRVYYDTNKDHTTNTIYIKPRKQADAEGMREFENSKRVRSWGGYPAYYIVITKDMTTEEFVELEKPQRMMFTIKSPVQVPKVECDISENGLATLSWKEVKDADEYIIYENTRYGTAKEYARTSETAFDAFHQSAINSGYITKDEAPDNWSNYDFNAYFSVSAVVDGVESRLSNRIEGKKYIDQLPDRLLKEDMPYAIDDLMEKLPQNAKVQMKSYSPKIIKNMPIEYDFLNLVDGKYAGEGIKYKVRGTPFTGYVGVKNYDSVLAQKLQEEQKARLSSGGVLETVIEEIVEEDPVDEEVEEKEVDLVETQEEAKEKIPETISLRTYLTDALTNDETEIYLGDYPEAANLTYLGDLLQAIMTQNPYILYENDCGYSKRTKTLTVEYEKENQGKVNKKREEIREKVRAIVNEVVENSMTDYEKEIALHDYLIDHTVYDYDALDDAEKNNFKRVSNKFVDSFNPYGVLINGVGVCQSYAEAYKLLCDEAGLECVVVTGDMDTMPHAWNKVKIDGMYYTVDATGNDNDVIPYFVFNTEDQWLEMEYTERKRYALDDDLYLYENDNSDYDYYVVNDLFVNSIEELETFLEQQMEDEKEYIVVKLFDKEATERDVAKVIKKLAEKNNLRDAGYGVALSTVYMKCEY